VVTAKEEKGSFDKSDRIESIITSLFDKLAMPALPAPPNVACAETITNFLPGPEGLVSNALSLLKEGVEKYKNGTLDANNVGLMMTEILIQLTVTSVPGANIVPQMALEEARNSQNPAYAGDYRGPTGFIPMLKDIYNNFSSGNLDAGFGALASGVITKVFPFTPATGNKIRDVCGTK
jgi:hypothetical protein